MVRFLCRNALEVCTATFNQPFLKNIECLVYDIFKYILSTKSCKDYGSSDQLTLIGHSGSNCSAFYLYRATTASLSHIPL